MTMDCDGKALKNKDMGARAPVAEGDITIQQPSNDGERLIADVAAPVFMSVGGVSFDDETGESVVSLECRATWPGSPPFVRSRLMTILEIDNVPIALRLVDELEGEEDEMFEALFPTPASGYGSQQPDGQQSSRTIARVIDALREDLGRLDWSRCGTPEF